MAEVKVLIPGYTSEESGEEKTCPTITLIKDASIELAKVIGTILQSNGDDYVDFFEGYYPADQIWTAGNDSYNGYASVLTLNKY